MDEHDGLVNTKIPAGLRRFLVVGVVGVALMLGGLGWDAAMHGADPDLAAHEGPLTLTNPSHLVAAVGVLHAALGLAGAIAATGRAATKSMGAIAVGVVVAVGGGGVVWAQATADPDDDHHDSEIVSDAASSTHDAEESATDDHVDHDGDTDMSATSVTSDEASCPESDGHANKSGLVIHGETDTDITAQDCAAADAWFDEVVAATARFEDLDVALAEGYVVEDAPQAIRHYRHRAYNNDGEVVDEDRPEGLVYYVGEGEPILLGILFTAHGDDLEQPGGTLTQWHDHSSQGCPESQPDCGDLEGEPIRMLHAWVFDGAVDRFAHDFPSAAGENQTAIPGRRPRG